MSFFFGFLFKNLAIFVLMSIDILNSDLTYLKGVGPKRAAILDSELHIRTYEQMLSYYPFRYIDRTQFHKIAEIQINETAVQLRARLLKFEVIGKGRAMRLSATVQDETGTLELVWFRGINWIKSKLIPQKEYLVYGKPSKFGHKVSITHPEIEQVSDDVELSSKLQAVYSSSDKLSKTGLSGKGIGYVFNTLIPQVKDLLYENLNQNLVNKYGFISHKEAIVKIHQPTSYDDIS